MSDLKTIAKQEMERTSLYEDSLEICRALLNAPYSSDYWAGEAECHIRGLWDHTKTLHKLLKAALAQPEQEPVAWMHTNGVGHRYFRLKPQDKVFNPVPLYTHPPRREWQGLTDEERRHIYATTEEFGHEIARAIEAALKEKNK